MKFDNYEKELIDLDEAGSLDLHVPEAEEMKPLRASAKETLKKHYQPQSEE